MTRVGFLTRLLAYLIDGIAVTIIYVMAELIARTVLPDIHFEGRTYAGDTLGAVVMLPFIILYMLTEVFFAGTPGKKLFRMSIGDEYGVRASRWRLFARLCFKVPIIPLTLLFLVLAVFVVLVAIFDTRMAMAILSPALVLLSLGGMLGFITFLGNLLALSDSKMALHDRLAGTAVYYGSIRELETERTAPPFDQQPQRPRCKAVDELIFK